MTKKKILFICTHNSARSQMAEGLLNALHGDLYEGYSGGTDPTNVNPYVVRAMSEFGIDISKHRSKNIKEFQGRYFDHVITLCDDAREACPFFPADKLSHKSFEDPSKLTGTEDQIMQEVRRIRDNIKDWIKGAFSNTSGNYS